jgi:hypothetical protein
LSVWHPSSEPIRHDTARFRARSTSHAVALLLKGCTNIPLAAGQAQENETILAIGFSSQGTLRFVQLDPPGCTAPGDYGIRLVGAVKPFS